jgi:hypothetical protein
VPRYLANAYTAEGVDSRNPEFWASCETARELTQVLSDWADPTLPIVLVEVWDMFINQDNPVFTIDHRYTKDI